MKRLLGFADFFNLLNESRKIGLSKAHVWRGDSMMLDVGWDVFVVRDGRPSIGGLKAQHFEKPAFLKLLAVGFFPPLPGFEDALPAAEISAGFVLGVVVGQLASLTTQKMFLSLREEPRLPIRQMRCV